MDDDVSERLLTDATASLTRAGATLVEITEIQRTVSAAQAIGAERLDEATAVGRRDAATRTAIMNEVAAAMEARAPRLARLVTWFEADLGILDATMAMILDRAEPLMDDPETRTLVMALAEFGPRAQEFEAATRGVVRGLDELGGLDEAVRLAAGRRAASLERLRGTAGTLAALGERAQAMIDDK